MTENNIHNQLINTLISIDETYVKIAKLSGVPENLYWLLLCLNDKEFHTQKEINNSWGLPKTTVNTLVKKLESQGYVTLSPIEERKRELQIALTSAGQSYANQVLAMLPEIESEIIRRIQEELPSSL
ncbi:MarR family winged helix-turn-helix transcriptional regulator [Streptococcus merionis]|uniref:MarR family winged helix-turn-helix transcriptional regulator n=1 Tax=Streptococcus merionis TaxID=400065 RepID=UPI0026EE8DBA|nr:MarR family transcriptional regulator [Streptococcus merionis]